ncbi:HD-GYP domain-containing protein [Meiothermus taiwanensis]|uniref:Cyclic di-GMP phosphodiesterase response regulator RpfG n=2 Tax=Meiothermus taiwanensis TaxID=172827 RepID=A0A399E047_9DEIN|nr:HD-GYP domain-containing protein [Meiothermus taiwanensis]AWR85659.1 metal dependent phosphohydrolase [Meiothermus taiwanensis WR-220]RIH78024.1 Cyclic di-GMP phosphodiesterase response regulator RpfG [Meiothermus taiwanensis]
MKALLPLPPLRVLLFLLCLLGAFVGLLYALRLQPGPYPPEALDMVFWAVLIVLARRIHVPLPFNAAMSHAFVVALATVTLFPAWLAAGLMFIFSFNKDFGRPGYTWYKDLFNRTQSGLATGLAGWAWGWAQAHLGSHPYLQEAVGIVAASLVYFFVNVGSVTYVIHLASGVGLRKVWFENYSWLWVSYLVQAPAGLLLAKAYQTPLVWGWGGFTVLFLMLLLYFSRYYWDEKVKLEESFDTTIELLVSALDAKDPFTRLHSERVAAIASSLAKRMGFDEQDTKRITYAARIHDIGKVAIPDSVLLKPGKLSAEEFALIKSHPAKGLEVLRPMLSRLSKDIQGVILHHHERWDGTGYPHGLKEEQIPLWARIIALADAYEAMTAGRAYSPAKTPQEALNEIIMQAGRQFDPQVVRHFEALWHEDLIWKDRGEFLRRYTLPAHLSGLSSLLDSGPASATSPTSSSGRPGSL